MRRINVTFETDSIIPLHQIKLALKLAYVDISIIDIEEVKEREA